MPTHAYMIQKGNDSCSLLNLCPPFFAALKERLTYMYEELGGGAVLPYRVLVQHPTINELLESCTSYRASVRSSYCFAVEAAN